MCAGVRDASNLGWKLALCARGLADRSLLDSYQAERSPHVREYITTAIRLGGLINSLDRKSAPSMVNKEGASGVRMRSIAPELGDSDLGGFGQSKTPHRGLVFAQPKLSDGQLMDDLIGYGPALITRVPLLKSTDFPTLSAADNPQIVTSLDALDVNAVLVRPDRYILATAKTQQEIAELADISFPSSINALNESETAV
jgi:3-(3-hydroxy-phenyl)propionate hydroxylase